MFSEFIINEMFLLFVNSLMIKSLLGHIHPFLGGRRYHNLLSYSFLQSPMIFLHVFTINEKMEVPESKYILDIIRVNSPRLGGLQIM